MPPPRKAIVTRNASWMLALRIQILDQKLITDIKNQLINLAIKCQVDCEPVNWGFQQSMVELILHLTGNKFHRQLSQLRRRQSRSSSLWRNFTIMDGSVSQVEFK